MKEYALSIVCKAIPQLTSIATARGRFICFHLMLETVFHHCLMSAPPLQQEICCGRREFEIRDSFSSGNKLSLCFIASLCVAGIRSSYFDNRCP